MSEPLLIGIEPTRHCNLRCVHCLRHDTTTREEMPFDLALRLLDEARAYGRPHIALTGGEPTLYSRLFDLLDAIVARGFTFHLVTNGQLFAELAPSLRRYRGPEATRGSAVPPPSAPLRGISFSLDGATEATHDAVRGRGSFRRAALAIGLARYEGFHVTVQLVVHGGNRGEVAAMPGLCKSLGVSALYISHAQPTPSLLSRGLMLSPAEWREVEAETRALARAGTGVPPRLAVGMYDQGCFAPCLSLQNRALNIDYRGRLSLCCQLSGVGDDEDGADVVADLKKTSLVTGHQRLLTFVRRLVSDRLQRLADRRVCELDAFQCWYCQKKLGKLDWLARHPDSPWVAGDPEMQALASARPRSRRAGRATTSSRRGKGLPPPPRRERRAKAGRGER